MSLTVLNVAYPLAPVGPDACGGAEQVLVAIDGALAEANQRSIVIAREGSTVRGELIALPAIAGPYDENAVRFVHHHCRLAVLKALRQWSVDIVHMHGVDFHAYLPPPDVPALVTLHLPIAWYPPAIFQYSARALFLNCVSASQNRECPACSYLLPPVYNGVEIPSVRRPERQDYALALGRICPEKGFHLALEAASEAGIPLVIAGQLFPYEEHIGYFRAEVNPRLGRLHRFIGPAGREAKWELYAGARCLVVASTVPETSSLVALEALACGTPVVAFRTGALPEIVVDGITGFLVDNVDEMAQAIRRAPEIDPEACRARVREHFSVRAMTARYMELYRMCSAAAPGQAHPRPAAYR